MPFELKERFTLEPWQDEAVSAWLGAQDPELGPRHGILEIYTGAGKTVVALGAMAAIAGHAYALAIGLILVNRLFDGLDGALARQHGLTDLGKFA